MSIPHPTTGSYPPRAGNAIRPLIDGVPAFRRIGKAIDQARHSVWLTIAFYAPDFQMPDRLARIDQPTLLMLEIVPMCRIPASTKPGATLPQGHAMPLPGRSDLSTDEGRF